MKDYYETENELILFSDVSGYKMGAMLEMQADWDGKIVVTARQKEDQELFVNLKGGQVMIIKGCAIEEYKAKFKEWLESRDQRLCK